MTAASNRAFTAHANRIKSNNRLWIISYQVYTTQLFNDMYCMKYCYIAIYCIKNNMLDDKGDTVKLQL